MYPGVHWRLGYRCVQVAALNVEAAFSRPLLFMHPSLWGSARMPICQAEVVAQSLQNWGRPEPDRGDGQRRPSTASGRLARLQQPEGCVATPYLPPALRRSQLVRGPLTGALTLADVQHAPPPTVATLQARLPLEQERERRVAWRTPHPLSSPRRPLEPWRRARDEPKPAERPYLARQMSWCANPQPGRVMHPPKPRG